MNLPDLPLARQGVDRAAEHRTDDTWLSAAWTAERTRVLVVEHGRARWREGADGAELVLVPPAEAPQGTRHFLGVGDDGEAYFALFTALPGESGPGFGAGGSADRRSTVESADGRSQLGDLRSLGTVLGGRDAGLLTHAVALEHWHRTHGFCARCGHPTGVVNAGHVRRCDSCGTEHFPRTDPAVIMLVLDRDDRALLGRHASWPPKRFSTLAGFVEPGESLEQAVAREVAEEVGVTVPVRGVSYLASQPWPFPASLMLGFHARAADDRVRVDGDEIAEARWFSREQLKDAVRSGELLLPGRISIARALIDIWYGESLQDAADW